MPLTTQSAGGIVAGSTAQGEPTVWVRLTRAICIAGARVEPGPAEVPKALASLLVGANKAERMEQPKPEQKPAEPEPEPVRRPVGRPRKEDV